jgi:hypothetical protein
VGELDIAAKVLLRTEPRALIALALPGARVRSVRAEETELPAQALAMDKLFRVAVAGETAPRWQHVEVVANWASHVPKTTFTYWSRASDRYARLRSFVLVLKPGDRQGTPTDEHVVRDGDEETLRFKFKLFCAWNLDADELLRDDQPGLLPLLPFASGATPERVERALRRLHVLRPRPRRAELLATLATFAGNVYPDTHWSARIPMEILMESTFYQQARADGARSNLAIMLRERLKGAAEAFVGRLELASDAQLEEATRLATRVRDAKALAAALDALLPTRHKRRPRPTRSRRRD